MDTSEDIGIDCITLMQEIANENYIDSLSFTVRRGGRLFKVTIEELEQ